MNEKDQVLKNLSERMPNTVQTLGYMEHQLDLVTKLTTDLLYLLTEVTRTVDPSDLPAGLVERLEVAETILESSSVDFENLTHPLQNYKLPSTVEHKKEMRKTQDRYLFELQQRGLLEG